MKTDSFKASTVDRLATADEIRAALLPTSVLAEKCEMEMFHEIAADTGGYVRISAEVFDSAMLVGDLGEDDSPTW